MSTKRLVLAAFLNFAVACSVPSVSLIEGQAATTSHERDGRNVDCTTTQVTAQHTGDPVTISVFTIDDLPVAQPVGDSFLKMRDAAELAGVKLTVLDGFRDDCAQTQSCDDATSHQAGTALDLDENGDWLVHHAGAFGFSRTLENEPAHWEFDGSDPGGVCADGNDP